MKNERILDKVSNLLNTTVENGASPEEAQTALVMAQRLMLKHNISLGDLKTEMGEITPENVAALEKNKLNWWDKILANSMAEYFRCKMYMSRSGRTNSIMFMGEPNDVEIMTMTYKFAHAQMEHYAKQYRRKRRKEHKAEYGSTDGFDGALVRNDFMNGFIKGLTAKLKEQSEENEEFALMVVIPNSVQKAYDDMGMRSARVGSRSANDAEARRAGYERGQQFSSASGSIEG